MLRPTTVGALARREAVLVSALGVGAAIALLAGPLGVPSLKFVGAIVAAVGAAARLGIAVTRASVESEREKTESARGLRAPVAPVAQIDPTLIGIDRAAKQSILLGGDVPQYVSRTADDEVLDAVACALDGSGPWMVVVHGPSKVGKSRSLFEALLARGQTSALELIAPVDASAVWSLLTPGERLWRESGAAVLWLDDLEPFLNEGVTWQTLREWQAGAPRRIVAATYGGKGSELIADSPTGGLATIASDVLGRAREVSLQATTPSELTELRPRLEISEAASLERHGLAAYLVAGPLLERKLNTHRHAPGHEPCPEGAALVYVAVDWARCGRTDPITTATLRGVWPSYLPPGAAATDDRFDVALAWALEPVVDGSSISLLQPVSSYEAFDYVVRLVRNNPEAPPVREEAWTAAVASAADAQALAVADSAYMQGRRDIALEALAPARRSSIDEIAAIGGHNFGVILVQAERSEEAIEVYDDLLARFGAASEPALREVVAKALFGKGVGLGGLGRFEEAIEVYDDLLARFGDAPEPALRGIVELVRQVRQADS